MAKERKWDAVPPQIFTLNGTQFGLVTIADTLGFKVKQTAYLFSLTQPTRIPVQVKRVISSTQLIVGAVDNKIASWTPFDISFYTLSEGSYIGAEEQDKNNIPDKDHYVAVYESDPVVADRILPVDNYGNPITTKNPFPTAPTGPQMTILANLLAMMVQGPTVIPPTTYLVNNEQFFIFDNEGNLIKAA